MAQQLCSTASIDLLCTNKKTKEIQLIFLSLGAILASPGRILILVKVCLRTHLSYPTYSLVLGTREG